MLYTFQLCKHFHQFSALDAFQLRIVHTDIHIREKTALQVFMQESS